MSEFELNLTRRIKASRKEVFEAWLSADTLAKIMRPADGMMDAIVENDPVEGGKYLIRMIAGEREVPHHGEYTIIDRYTTLAFTWLSDYTIPGSLVTITFNEIAENETELNFHHVGFPSEKECASHTEGWGTIITLLDKFLS